MNNDWKIRSRKISDKLQVNFKQNEPDHRLLVEVRLLSDREQGRGREGLYF